MAILVLFQNVTLDGVMQAPGRADEDTRGGFQHGGWAIPYADPVLGQAASDSMATTGGILLGRRTYEDFYKVWPNRTDNPFTGVLNNTPKYVASTTLQEPLPWMNSFLLKGHVPEAVATIKAEQEKDIVVLGSGVLVSTLMMHDLIDVYILLTHPLVLGSGTHLFPEGSAYTTLHLVDSKTTSKGVTIATYRPAPKQGV